MTQKYNFIKFTLLLLVNIVLGYSVTAQMKNEFSVKQAVDYGLKNSVQVKNALLDIKIQEQENKELTAQAFPQINANGSFNDYINIPTTLIPGEFFNQPPGSFIPVKFTTKYNSSGGVTLNQIIFDGQVFVGLQARSTAIAVAKSSAEFTQEQIKASIYKIYYQLVVGQKQLATVQANINEYEKLLHDTKEIYKNGFAEKLDIDKINVQLNNLLTQKQVVQGQLDAGNEGLKFLIQMPQKDSLSLTDTLSDEQLKSNILDESYNYKDRKDIQLLTYTAKLNEYNVKRYQLSKIPTLSGTASYSKNAGGNEFNFINGDWYTTSYVGLNLTIPIFNGFNKKATLQEAKYTWEKSKNNLEQLKQSVDNDVSQARIKMKNALATIDNQKQNIQLAENVYNSTKLKYEQGLGSNQQIYDAQTQLEIAQNNYYGALYDAIIAKINFLQAIGKL